MGAIRSAPLFYVDAASGSGEAEEVLNRPDSAVSSRATGRFPSEDKLPKPAACAVSG